MYHCYIWIWYDYARCAYFLENKNILIHYTIMANSQPEPAPAPKSMSMGATVGIVFFVLLILLVIGYILGPTIMLAFQ